MIIDTTQPALMSREELIRLSLLSISVPENGIIVEVGSFLGGSTWHIAKNSHSSCSIICFDPFNNDVLLACQLIIGENEHLWQSIPEDKSNELIILKNQSTDKKIKQMKTVVDFVKKYGNPQKNNNARDLFDITTSSVSSKITKVCECSPPVGFKFTGLVDMYFDDGDHRYEAVKSNLEFWYPLIRYGGVVCGHDYSDQFPGVIAAVDELAEKVGATVAVSDSLWYFRK